MVTKKTFRFVVAMLMLCALMSSGAYAALAPRAIHGGVLGYLGTTEDEFQAAVDNFSRMLPAFSFGLNNSPLAQEFVEFLIAFRDHRHIIHFYDNLTSMLMALNSGRVDEISLPESTARYVMRSDPAYRIIFTIRMPSAISFGFRAEDTGLCGDFNKVIEAMKEDGTLKALEEKYIKDASENPEAAAFENFGEDAGKITIAITGDMPPIDFVAEDGKPAGYNTAVLSEIGKRLKKNINVINIEAGARSSALVSGKADVIFWYRSTKGMDIPEETGFKGENPLNTAIKDSTEGVILSTPYYEWERTLMLTK
ncbi:MAG: transporter substrate-binding domain-containing protein [Synergistales bacterium]|nr:transporter substrate-binding domain-containing protein [Synergistales bacterium]MDY6401424.1 transporter substrate-binding domain-containing protein [Synergistales bacterium]MDY6404939.1 transporter substrate-binding domain-containing protein [Synergistales bacterium]MDY6410364.1 transporter substrate-binding domain-containing protein [Synergistales bacterium]MDY6422078.1 transporter substrate-binding domain-containing protein [Synergistales bacterium]